MGVQLLGDHARSFRWLVEKRLGELLLEIGTLQTLNGHWIGSFTGAVRWSEVNGWQSARKDDRSYLWKVQGEVKVNGKVRWVNFGYWPAVGPEDSFWLEGVERIVVHQLLRSPGVYWKRSGSGNEEKSTLFILTDRGSRLRLTSEAGKVLVRAGKRIWRMADWLEGLAEESDEVVGVVRGMYLDYFGRQRFNKKVCAVVREEALGVGPWLELQDIRALMKLWEFWVQHPPVNDDGDSLENKRVWSVGRQLEREIWENLTILKNTWANSIKEDCPDIAINFADVITGYLKSSPTSQVLDQTNPLAALGHRRRITLKGKGGVPVDSIPDEIRNVHLSHIGRVCPVDAGGGKSIGIRYQLAYSGVIREDGVLGTLTLEKKTAKQTIWWADDEDRALEIQPGLSLWRGRLLRQNGDLIWWHFLSTFSSSLACTPFLEHTDAARAVMSAEHQGQGIAPWKVEQPLVLTTEEATIAHASGFNIYSPMAGVVSYVDSQRVQIKSASGIWEQELIKWRGGNTRSSAKVQLHQRPAVHIGQTVKEGALLADGYGSKNGVLSLGANLWIAYLAYEGFNYEDGIVVSEKVARAGRLRTVLMKTYRLRIEKTSYGEEVVGVKELQPWLEPYGIARVGTWLEKGMVVTGKLIPRDKGEWQGEDYLLNAIFPEDYLSYREKLVYMKIGEYGRVVDSGYRKYADGGDLLGEVLVTIAYMSKLEIGDKMSGRNGNKGIVTKIVPEEDMPFMPDGTPLDVVLNPLGVPSRMNVGQVYETQLGLCARVLGQQYRVPQFDEVYGMPSKGFLEEELAKARQKAPWIGPGGLVRLRDGRTGELMDRPVCVGSQYMLSSEHMVSKKEHARGQGSYDRVTGQPVSGRKLGGGQKIGEMEMWALLAHGAAYNILEMTTVKSDSEEGRQRCLQEILNGRPVTLPRGTGMAFEALEGELKGLCLDVIYGNQLEDNQVPMPEEQASFSFLATTLDSV